jgi:alkyl hydroperoxide reductase subunit AhpC
MLSEQGFFHGGQRRYDLFMIRRLIVVPALLLVILFPSGAFAGSLEVGAYIIPVGGIKVGDSVPVFHAKGIMGEDLDLSVLLQSDKKIVLAFWSMYCSACLEKFSSMITIQEKYREAGLEVISINTDGEYRKSEQAIRDFISSYEEKQRAKVNFPVLYDESNWLALAMNVNFLPTIITVDSKGKVHNIYRRFGEESEAEILQGIETIVKELLASGGGAAKGAE